MSEFINKIEFIERIHDILKKKYDIDTDSNVLKNEINNINSHILVSAKNGYISVVVKFTLDNISPEDNIYFYQLNTLASKRYAKDYLFRHYINEKFTVYEDSDDLIIEWNMYHE